MCAGVKETSTKGGERGLILQGFILAFGHQEIGATLVAIPFLKTE